MPPNPIQTIGLGVLVPYLFILYSRVFDVKFTWLHIPMLLSALLIVLSAASMQVFGALSRTRIGRFLGWFTIWALIGVPFSVWRTGCFAQATQVWPRALLLFVAIACMVTSLNDVRRVIFTLGFAIIALGLISRIFGDMEDGRLFLPQGKFENPNDLAQALLMGFPFLLFILMEGNKLMKLLVVLGMIPLFQALIRTGSRGGMLGLLVILAFVFFRCSLGGKMMAVVGGAAVLVIAMAVLPQSLLMRYVTLFHAEGTESTDITGASRCPTCVSHEEEMAAGSANERYELLQQSIRMSLKNPVLGVGMGQFPVAREKEADRQGIHVPWRVTHNSYTQVSSETGIVGLVLYMTAFFGSIGLCRQLGKFAEAKAHPQWKLISRMTFCLQMSLLSYAVTSFFASVAYQQAFPTLAGIVVGLMQAVEPEFSAWKRQTKAAKRTPVEFPARRVLGAAVRAA